MFADRVLVKVLYFYYKCLKSAFHHYNEKETKEEVEVCFKQRPSVMIFSIRSHNSGFSSVIKWFKNV